MRNWRRTGLQLLTVCLAFAPLLAGQDKGWIRGIVVDEKDIPLNQAKVNADAMNGRTRATAIRYVETDGSGHFLIDRLEWGKYTVFAMKEDSGYPNMALSFYSNDAFPSVTITPAAPTAEIRIQLGPKAGILTGSLVNAANGAPVDAGFKLIRAASPGKWISTSVPPNYRILVPSSTDVLLEASAPGFKTWNPGHPLHLGPGAEMRLDILLEPSHDPNLHPSKFLVPDGYAGWLLLEYNIKDAEPTPIEAGVKVFKFPPNGALNTSASGPERGADDEYLYYSADGSLREIPTGYRNGKGMIWGQHEGTRNGTLSQFGFFVGTEEQYKKYQLQATHPGPISTP
jgi:hypothetical protein